MNIIRIGLVSGQIFEYDMREYRQEVDEQFGLMCIKMTKVNRMVRHESEHGRIKSVSYEPLLLFDDKDITYHFTDKIEFYEIR